LANTKVIDYDKLYNLAKIGLSEEQIAVSLGISVSTIARRKRDDDTFADTLKAGKQAGISAVTNALFESATAEKPNTSAQIFYLKNRAGWRDRTEVDANIYADVTVTHDIDAALQALRDAGVDPSSL
jgi:transcriptional regulator with XRE-family HTH domain